MNDPAKNDASTALPTNPCANCGNPLQGKYCYYCGQPVKGMIRPLSGLAADVVDSVFNLDSRILRTIGPLFFKPGYLTTEYFIGRRTRYVTPFRLVFFLTIVAFLAAQFFSDQSGLSNSPLFKIGSDSIAAATSQETVDKFRDDALKQFDEQMRNQALPPEAREALQEARAEILKQAQARNDYLRKVAEARAKGLPIPLPQNDDEGNPLPDPPQHPRNSKRKHPSPADATPADATPADAATDEPVSEPAEAPAMPVIPGDNAIQPPAPPVLPVDIPPVVIPPVPAPPTARGGDPKLTILGDKAWDAKTNPLTVGWLPDAANAKLNEMIGNGIKNAKLLRTEPKRVVSAFFGVIPQTLFVLMPLFAVMLKFFYIFKRRYYTEHLIVALHSHAFLALSMLLLSLLGLAQLAWPAISTPLHWLIVAVAWWIPIYLLLMQKRVYRQNWFMTLLKFGIIGTCYSVLITFAIVIAGLLAFATA